MLEEKKLEKIMKKALSSGGDFAEIFFEDKDELNIKCSEKVISRITTVRIKGAGIYLLSDKKSVYVYTNDLTFQGLMNSAERASELIEAQGKKFTGNIVFSMQKTENPNKFEIYPSTVDFEDKIRVIRETDLAARSAENIIKQLNVDYFDTDQKVVIFNSEGLLAKDRRVTSRLRLQATVEAGNRSKYEWGDFTRPQGFEAFRTKNDYTSFAKGFIEDMAEDLRAVPLKSCSVPVVFDAGSCGTFWHETCGHQLEASAISRNASDFVGKIGSTVASEKVTLIDDGTIPGLYGTAAIDDEGHPTQKNVLIENGILKKYLCDRLCGRKLGISSTGSGRRQGYTYAPVPRMNNTYLAPGNDSDDEIINSVDNGLFVKRLGGGTGGREFSIAVSEGYWIKNGKVDHRLRSGFILNGRGIDMIKKVDMVGRTMETEGGGFCGADSGLCPVTSFQPRMRITLMFVGGED
jgi:TldD protein